MSDLNVVALVGNVTRDPELRNVGEKKTAVTSVGLAVNGFNQDEVSFVDVTLWGKQAEFAVEYAKKGKKVAVNGRLRQESWEKDGEKRSKLVVVAENIQLLTPKGEGDAPSEGGEPAKRRGRPPKTEKPANTAVGEDQEIPF